MDKKQKWIQRLSLLLIFLVLFISSKFASPTIILIYFLLSMPLTIYSLFKSRKITINSPIHIVSMVSSFMFFVFVAFFFLTHDFSIPTVTPLEVTGSLFGCWTLVAEIHDVNIIRKINKTDNKKGRSIK